MATTLRRTIKRGDTWKAIFSWFDGVYPLDLTGASARMQLRSKGSYAQVLEVSTVSGELSIPEPLKGQIALEVDAVTTAALDPAVYLCDAEVTLADGSVQSSETFEIAVERDITYDD